MKLGHLLVALGVLALVGLLLFVSSREQEDTAPETPNAVTDTAPVPPAREHPVLASGLPARLDVAEVRHRGESLSHDSGPSGIRGRLVFSDGRPCQGTQVEWASVDWDLLIGADFTPESTEGPSSEWVDRATSGVGGEFELIGQPRTTNALVVDRGGPFAATHSIDVVLAPGSAVDLGDIVIDVGEVLTGRVLDESGTGIPGVRVRAALLPSWWTDYGLEALSSSSFLAVHYDRFRAVLPVPEWLAPWLDHPPLPTTRTDSEGRFVLRNVDALPVHLVLDAPGRTVHAELLTPDGERPIDIVLPRGSTIAGRVRDADGSVVAEARVIGGVVSPRGELTLLAPARSSTDVEGRFELDAVRSGKSAFFAVRAPDSIAWQLLGPCDLERPVELELEPAFDLDVRVVDRSGSAVDAERVTLRPRYPLFDHPVLGVMARAADPPVRELERTGPGQYRARRIRRGDYGLVVGAAGMAEKQVEVSLLGPREVVVQLEAGGFGKFVVLGPADEPVSNVQITVFVPELDARFTGLTDASGLAKVGPLATSLAAVVRATHPAFASTQVALRGGELSQATVYEIHLEGGGVLEGAVRAGDSALPTTLALVLDQNSRPAELLDEFRLQWHAIDALGAFRIGSLAPGKHTYRLVAAPRSLDGLLTRLVPTEGAVLAGGSFDIESGRITRITIDLEESDRTSPGSLRGTVHVHGQPAGNVTVTVSELQGGSWSRSCKTDQGGRFDLGAVPAGELALEVYSYAGGRVVPLETRLLELQPGERGIVEVDLDPIEVLIEVIDPVTGRAALGADIHVWSDTGFGLSASTNASGHVTVQLPEAGSYYVKTALEGHEACETPFEVGALEGGKSVIAKLGKPLH